MITLYSFSGKNSIFFRILKDFYNKSIVSAKSGVKLGVYVKKKP